MKKKISPVLIFAGTVNLILFTVKFYIGVRTNSLCIYTDSINNLMDALSLCLALVGVSFINKPKSEKFPFGFGKMEAVTSFVMAIIMTAAGASFAYNSLVRLMTPVPLWYFTKYALIIGFTAIVKLILGIIFTHKYKRSHSPILKAVMLDSFLDFAITLITVISFISSGKTNIVLDGALGFVISIIIAVMGIRLIVASASSLIGKKDSDTEKEVNEIIKSIDGSVKIKNIFIHSYGDEKYIALTLEAADIDKNQSIQKNIKEQLSTHLDCSSTVEWEVIS